jgi:hypothetical protein
MIHDHNNICLFKPGVAGFSDLPALLDDADKRPGPEQLGGVLQPISGIWRLEDSALHGDGVAHRLLGAIRLVAAANQLVMVFEGGIVAIVQSDRGTRRRSGRLRSRVDRTV